MPNWKTYESSVRLLSAILAAHPDLRLNYQEIADSYGGGCTKSAARQRLDLVRHDAKRIKDARSAGIDPITLVIGGKEISRCFGGDSTHWAINNRFRGIKVDAKRIREALDAGIDPSTIEVGATNGSNGAKDISDRFGGDCTKSALENRFRVIKSDAKRINDAFAKGIDPSTLTVGAKEMSRFFGSDGPSSALQSQMKKIKHHINRVKAAVDKGIDPLTLEIVIGPEISKYYGDCTVSALEHRFRPIKHQAKELRAGLQPAIADKYEEGTTAKAISTRIDRAKKEEGWIKNESPVKNGSPKKAKMKTEPLMSPSDSYGQNEEEDTIEVKTPTSSKKSVLNRTQGGRVTKTTPRKAARTQSYAEFDEDTPEDSEDELHIVEKPSIFGSGNRNGRVGNGYATNGTGMNGYANGYAGMNYDGEDQDEDMHPKFYLASSGSGHQPYMEEEDDEV